MTEETSPSWLALARFYFATGDLEPLDQAIEHCSDRDLLEFLNARRDTDDNDEMLDPGDWFKLRQRAEGTDHAAVCLLADRDLMLLLASPDKYDEATIQTAVQVANSDLSLAQQHSFVECEAWILSTLGLYQSELRHWQTAEELMLEAAAILQHLVATQRELFLPSYVANTNNLAAIYSLTRRFPEARQLNELIVPMMRELCEAEWDIWAGDLAGVISNLATTHSQTGYFVAALQYQEEATEIRRKLCSESRTEYLPDLGDSLTNLGNVLESLRDFRRARDVLVEAVEIYRALILDGADWYYMDLATALLNLGNVEAELREFPASLATYEEALAINQALAEEHKSRFQPDVALCLHNLANVYDDVGESEAAKESYRLAIEIRRDIFAESPEIIRDQLAMSLNNLATAYGREKEQDAALRYYDESLQLYRQGSDSSDLEQCASLALCLSNRGSLLDNIGRDDDALRDMHEAIAIRRKLAQDAPMAFAPLVAAALNNLAMHLMRSGDHSACLVTASEAIDAAEHSEIPAYELHLSKSQAIGAYIYLLSRIAGGQISREPDDVFRLLVSMRVGHARTTDHRHTLATTQEVIADVSQRIGRSIAVVIAETTEIDGGGETGAVLVLLTADDLQLWKCDAFHDHATELQGRLNDSFEDRGAASEAIKTDIIAVGNAAWQSLPEPIRDVLIDHGSADVLISGDSFYTAFPWELLNPSPDGPPEWLGRSNVLARWQDISTDGLRRLIPSTIGSQPDGTIGKTAALVCPWDAVKSAQLPGVVRETNVISESLSALGFESKPIDSPFVGDQADRTNLARVIAEQPDVIYFSGHGAVTQDEEVLVCWLEECYRVDGHTTAPFGRRELRDIKSKMITQGVSDDAESFKVARLSELIHSRQLFENHPLLILNCCFGGRVRRHGGQREDLTAALIAEGAEAVIASATPVYADAGELFGKVLFRSSQDVDTVSSRFLFARCEVERRHEATVMWAAWATFAFHGNPYASMTAKLGTEA